MPSGYGGRVRVVGQFDPSMGGGLTAWYRELHTESGSNVSQWTDKSGNGYHAIQATGAAKPVVSTHADIGNHELYTFNGSASFMALVTKSSLISTSAFTIYALVKAGTATANNANLYRSNSIVTDAIGLAANFGIVRRPAVSNIGWGASIPTSASNTFTLTDATWTKCVWAYDGNKAYARKSGGSDAGLVAGGNVNQMSDPLYVGGKSGGSADVFYPGAIAELIFFNQYHSVAQQDLIFAYQLAYFGL